jgi:hypothetical protein
MVLKKLEELGYKPKKSREKEGKVDETEDILKNIESSEAKKQILDLLLDALSETDPREILIYGMYVKKHFSPVIRSTRKGSIEKTMQRLTEELGKK